MADYLGSITRHLDDLRTRTYGGHATRDQQMAHFGTVVGWLNPIVVDYLQQADTTLLDSQGIIERSRGLVTAPSGTVWAWWSLTWPELIESKVTPARIAATFFPNWQHPHLHGSFPGPIVPPPDQSCTSVWPLQVSDEQDVQERRGVLEAIIETELHAKICHRRSPGGSPAGTPTRPGSTSPGTGSVHHRMTHGRGSRQHTTSHPRRPGAQMPSTVGRLPLAGRTAIVTGAAGGIGRAVTQPWSIREPRSWPRTWRRPPTCRRRSSRWRTTRATPRLGPRWSPGPAGCPFWSTTPGAFSGTPRSRN